MIRKLKTLLTALDRLISISEQRGIKDFLQQHRVEDYIERFNKARRELLAIDPFTKIDIVERDNKTALKEVVAADPIVMDLKEKSPAVRIPPAAPTAGGLKEKSPAIPTPLANSIAMNPKEKSPAVPSPSANSTITVLKEKSPAAPRPSTAQNSTPLSQNPKERKQIVTTTPTKEPTKAISPILTTPFYREKIDKGVSVDFNAFLSLTQFKNDDIVHIKKEPPKGLCITLKTFEDAQRLETKLIHILADGNPNKFGGNLRCGGIIGQKPIVTITFGAYDTLQNLLSQTSHDATQTNIKMEFL